ncbi:MAG: ArsR family transcriptional regulator [Desulforhopalus sp.]|jgi:ArsR family transcriptional regulator
MKKLQKLFSALSDKSRLRIIAALREYEEMCACQIVELLQLTGATTSKHLSILMQAGVLDSYKEGRWVHYRLDYSNHSCDQVMAWLGEQLYQTDTVKADQLALKEIMLADREDICRKQRGEKCCPVKEH